MKRLLLLLPLFLGQLSAQRNWTIQGSFGPAVSQMDYYSRLSDFGYEAFAGLSPGFRGAISLYNNKAGQSGSFYIGTETYRFESTEQINKGFTTTEFHMPSDLKSFYSSLYAGYSFKLASTFYVNPRIGLGFANYELNYQGAPANSDSMKYPFQYEFESNNNLIGSAAISFEYKFLKKRKASSNAVFSISAGLNYCRNLKGSAWRAYNVKTPYVGEPLLNTLSLDVSLCMELNWIGNRF